MSAQKTNVVFTQIWVSTTFVIRAQHLRHMACMRQTFHVATTSQMSARASILFIAGTRFRSRETCKRTDITKDLICQSGNFNMRCTLWYIFYQPGVYIYDFSSHKWSRFEDNYYDLDIICNSWIQGYSVIWFGNTKQGLRTRSIW